MCVLFVSCVSSVLRVPNARLAKYVFLCGFPQACREKHVAAEGFMVYGVVCEGVVQCSNSLEDEEDNELLPQALVYKSCRQRIYSLLLLHGHDGRTADIHTHTQTSEDINTHMLTSILATPYTQSENHNTHVNVNIHTHKLAEETVHFSQWYASPADHAYTHGHTHICTSQSLCRHLFMLSSGEKSN